MVGAARHQGGRHPQLGYQRVVVDHHADLERVRNADEVPDESFFARHVVVGKDHLHPVRAGALRRPRQVDRQRGPGFGGAGDHRQPPASRLNHGFDHLQAVAVGQGVRFARAPGRDQHHPPAPAAFHQKLGVGLESIQVKTSIAIGGRCQHHDNRFDPLAHFLWG